MTLRSRRSWVLPEHTSRDKVTETILKVRGVDKKFFSKYLDDSKIEIPDPYKLKDVRAAAIEIVTSIKDGKKIFIHGDFDADGICAVAILWEFLYRDLPSIYACKPDVIPYIPSRVDEGYGLSEGSIAAMKELGAELVITVDCGIRDGEIIEKNSSQGLKFIITDHHQPEDGFWDQKKRKYLTVHPMDPKGKFPEEKTSGCTVAYFLILGIVKYLEEKKYLEKDALKSEKYLDLVALSLTTDLMPLLGVNRALVKAGLEVFHSSKRVGMLALIESANITKSEIDTYHLGYIIGPRLNATGRIGNPMDALRLMVTDKIDFAGRVANQIDLLNRRRKEMTDERINEARKMANIDSKILIIVGQEWEEGIIGLVAGKLLESEGKPVICISKKGAQAKGSARSPIGFNITDLLEKHSDYLEKYGGHEQAAGFTVKENKLDKMIGAIESYVEKHLKLETLNRELKIDLTIDSSFLDRDVVEELEKLKPYGIGNRKPLLALLNGKIIEKFKLGTKPGNFKLKILCSDSKTTVDTILFGADQDWEILNVGMTIDISGSLQLNEWNGRSDLQFMLREWRESES